MSKNKLNNLLDAIFGGEEEEVAGTISAELLAKFNPLMGEIKLNELQFDALLAQTRLDMYQEYMAHVGPSGTLSEQHEEEYKSRFEAIMEPLQQKKDELKLANRRMWRAIDKELGIETRSGKYSVHRLTGVVTKEPTGFSLL